MPVLLSAQESDEVYRVVSKMPLAKTCVNIENKVVERLCHVSELQKFIFGHDKYLEINDDSKYMHTVTVIIEKDGTLSDIKHRSVDEDIRQLLDSILLDMSDTHFFMSGEHNGEKVRVRYVIPIKIDIKNKEGIIPIQTDQAYISDADFIELLEVPVTINGKRYSSKRIDRLNPNCSPNFDLTDWLWNDSDEVSIDLWCE